MAALLRAGVPDRVPWLEHSVAAPIQGAIMGCDPDEVDPFEFAKAVGLDGVSFMGLQPMLTVGAETSAGTRRHASGGLRTKADWEEWVLTWPDPRSSELFAELEAFIERCRRTDLAVFYGGALVVALIQESWGLERFSYLLMDDPGFVREMLDVGTAWNIAFHAELCKRDLDFVYTGNDLSHKGGTFFSLEYLRREVFPREKAVAREITLPWLYHCCGDFSSVAEDIIDHGCDAIDPFQPEAIDIVDFKQEYGDKVCVKGNVSLQSLMWGTPDDVEVEVREKISRLAPGGGYIVASAHSIYGACKPENVVRMGEAIRRYGEYPIGGQ